jgi:pyruvate dehydrogenase E1 component alpha subunit
MSSIEINKDTYLKWYESMLLMRKFEEKAGQLYGQQKIRGFCHLYIGQEAVLAGAMSVLKKGDSMITAYRDHAHAIAQGVNLPDAQKVKAVLCTCLAKNITFTAATV